MAVANPEGLFVGALFLVVGLACARWPYRIARLSERIDAIGSKRRWSQVEPADWLVGITRYGGAGMALAGTIAVLANL